MPTTHSKIKARLVSVYGISLRIPTPTGGEGPEGRVAFHARRKIRSSRSTGKTSRTFANYCTLAWITAQLRYNRRRRRRRHSTGPWTGVKANSPSPSLSPLRSWRREITLYRVLSLFKTDCGAPGRGLHSLTIIPSRWRPRVTTKLSHFAAEGSSYVLYSGQ